MAVLTVFIPLDVITRAVLSYQPFSLQMANSTLLVRALKIVVPSLALLGLTWLSLGSPIRRRFGAKLALLLDARWALVSLAILTAALQIGWLSFYPTRPYADSQWYYDKAIDLSVGRGYIYDLATAKPTAAWPVGYPAVLAIIFAVTRPSLLVAELANVAFATLAVMATYLLGRRIFNHHVALVAAFLLGTLPGFVVYSSLVASDILFLLLMVCVLGLVLVDEDRLGLARIPAALFVVGLGLLCGAMTLVRSTALAVMPALGLIHWLATTHSSADRKSFGRWVLALGIGTGLVVLPWTVRNYVRLHRLIVVSTNGGLNFWIGNNPLANGGFVFPRDDAHNPLLSLIGDEVAVDEAGYRLGIEFARHNPARVLALLPAKIFYLYYANDDGLEWDLRSAITRGQPGTGPIAHAAINGSYLLLLMTSGAGLAILLVNKRKAFQPIIWTGVIFGLNWTLAHLPFFGTNRFSLPVLPFIALYGAFGLLSLIFIDETDAGKVLDVQAPGQAPAENRL